MRILIAEDDESTGEIYTLMFASKGHDVIWAKDGQEGIQKYKESMEKHRPFDVVNLDYRMPKKDGIEAAKEIQAINPRQRIIIASAYVNDIVRESARSLDHPVPCIDKPIDLEKLEELLGS